MGRNDFAERMAQICDGTDVGSRKRNGTIHLINVRIAADDAIEVSAPAKSGQCRLGQMILLATTES